MKFKVSCQSKNGYGGLNLEVRARSKKRAIRKILLENKPINRKDFEFFFKYPAER